MRNSATKQDALENAQKSKKVQEDVLKTVIALQDLDEFDKVLKSESQKDMDIA